MVMHVLPIPCGSIEILGHVENYIMLAKGFLLSWLQLCWHNRLLGIWSLLMIYIEHEKRHVALVEVLEGVH